MTRLDRYDVGAAVGVLSLSIGLAWWWMPAALVFLGAVTLALSLAAARRFGRAPGGRSWDS